MRKRDNCIPEEGCDEEKVNSIKGGSNTKENKNRSSIGPCYICDEGVGFRKLVQCRPSQSTVA